MVEIRELLKRGTVELEISGLETPRLDAEVLLYRILDVERLYLHMYPEKLVPETLEHVFWDHIQKRKAQMPIQYIIKEQEFMGLDFYVDERVLIPRGDTEILVEKALCIYKEEFNNNIVRIMDLGTGSGAIAISLGHFIEKSLVTAVDISTDALSVAKKNAEKNQVESKIQFYLGSLFEPLDESHKRAYDFIVSNPPYIPNADVDTLKENVKGYEPHLALAGGVDGLDFYKEITKGSRAYLKPEGWLLFEIGYDQGEAVSQLLLKEGFHQVQILKDLAGLDRVVLGKK